MPINELFEWIEAHPTTVELLMWTGVLFIAWFSGLFRFLGKFKQRCKLEVITTASRCLVEKFDEHNGAKDVMRVAFIIDASVVNPTNEKAVVEVFRLSYKGQRLWVPGRRSGGMHPISMPNRPRQVMGGATRFSKVFFSNIIDGSEGLTMSGSLEPKEFQNGYMMFVSFTWGSWNPRIVKDHILVKLEAKLTTGEILKSKAWVPVIQGSEWVEEWIPGITEHVNQEYAWSGFMPKWKK